MRWGEEETPEVCKSGHTDKSSTNIVFCSCLFFQSRQTHCDKHLWNQLWLHLIRILTEPHLFSPLTHLVCHWFNQIRAKIFTKKNPNLWTACLFTFFRPVWIFSDSELWRIPSNDDIMQKIPPLTSHYHELDAASATPNLGSCSLPRPRMNRGERVHKFTGDGFEGFTISQQGGRAFVSCAPNTGSWISWGGKEAKVNPQSLKDNQSVLLGEVSSDL